MVFTLVQHGAAWGLPSLDPFCIQAQAHLKLAAVDYETEEQACNPDSQQIPYLEDGDDVALSTDPGGIFGFLRDEKGIDLDNALTEAEKAELQAFRTLLDCRLNDALECSLWLEEDNYGVIRDVYASSLPYPLNHILPMQKRRQVAAQLNAAAVSSNARDELYREAGEAYAALSARLGQRRFFFEERPSSLDAAAVAHLLFLSRAPLADTTLKDKAFLHPNLQAYVTNMEWHLFGEEAAQAARVPPPFSRVQGKPRGRTWFGTKKKSEKPRTEEQQRFRRRARYFVVAQIACALLYVLLTGVVVAEVEDDGEEMEEGGEDDDE